MSTWLYPSPSNTKATCGGSFISLSSCFNFAIQYTKRVQPAQISLLIKDNSKSYIRKVTNQHLDLLPWKVSRTQLHLFPQLSYRTFIRWRITKEKHCKNTRLKLIYHIYNHQAWYRVFTSRHVEVTTVSVFFSFSSKKFYL